MQPIATPRITTAATNARERVIIAKRYLTANGPIDNIVGVRPTPVPAPPNLRPTRPANLLTVPETSTFARIRKNVVLRTALYYVALFGVTWLLRKLPITRQVMKGSLEQLISSGGFAGLGGPSNIEITGTGAQPVNEVTMAVTVLVAMVGALALALPVAWIYGMTRAKRGYQQSVVQSLMILPPLVASVVVLVKYSLALAFGLGGIMAAIRFRSTLEDSKDAVYIFFCTALGLTAAVQLPVAAVISVVFNLIVLTLWYTDFGKATAFDGERAKRKMEDLTRQRMRQTGTFVAMVDNELFDKMTPQQLDMVADRAWRRRRRLETDEASDEEAQKRDVLLRIKCKDTDVTRIAIEQSFEEFLKKWRLGGVVHEPDGTHFVEYAVQMKKGMRTTDFLDELQKKDEVMEAEIK